MHVALSMRVLAGVVAFLVFASVWFPLLDHYFVSNPDFNPGIIDEARNSPSDASWNELDEMRFFSTGLENDNQWVQRAEMYSRGEIDLPGFPTARISLPFRADDLEKSPPELQLMLASLGVPDILIEAYERTGREEFFLAARDVILEWARYERHAWLPRGFLWNDHAIAARTLVLARFWRLYRHHRGYQPQTAKTILEFAARNAAFLAKPSHFTFATNHGVMQNLALLHLCVAFPSLTNRKKYQELAVSRLQQQFKFYVDDEGVVLEHSAEYHQTGLQFIALACNYLRLLNEPIPADWIQKYEKAMSFYSLLRRPDGSLPNLGDTNDGRNTKGPQILKRDTAGRFAGLEFNSNWRPLQPYSVFPVAGYAVWWEGLNGWPDQTALRQTVTAWSYSPGSAHKHADEMSVLLWAAGRAWWTNTGYWPYGREGRELAESWPGSNAPHLSDEPANSFRETRLLASGTTKHLSALHLERHGPENYHASRQVVYWKPNVWIVLDNASGPAGKQTTHTWTTAANLELRPGSLENSFVLRSQDAPASLTAFLISSPGTKTQIRKGSMRPFVGWQVAEHVPEPASALVVEQSTANSWSAAVWSLEEKGTSSVSFTASPSMVRWGGEENWEIKLPLAGASMSISRQNQEISLHQAAQRESTEVLTLAAPPDTAPARSQISASFAAAGREYPHFRDRVEYRWKVSYLLGLAFVLQELVFLSLRRVKGKYNVALRIVSVLAWIAAGVWVVPVFLR